MIPHSSLSDLPAAKPEPPLPVSSINSIEGPARSPVDLLRQNNQPRRTIKIPYFVLQHFLALVDAGLIVFASLVGGELYQFLANRDLSRVEPLLGAGTIAALLYVLIGQSSGFYDLRTAVSHRNRDIGRILTMWFLVSVVSALLAFLLKSGAFFSRGSIICFDMLAVTLLLTFRQVSKRVVATAVANGKVLGRRAIVLGTRDELASLGAEEVLERYGCTEVERIIFSSADLGGFAMTANETSSLDKALEIARGHGADEIVLALPWSDSRRLELVRDALRASPLPVQLLPDRRIRSLADNPSYRIRSSFSVEIQRGPLSRAEQLFKRSVDIVGASIGLVILAPLVLLTAVLIKADSAGPVLFRQRRNGFNTMQFAIFKFRTMTVMEDGSSVTQAERFDRRVTRVGRLLRRSSIDEVPQLLNVLRGEMSLVGPRPHAIAHDNQYGDLLSDYAFRHHVKPGITGWAQVKGYRGETARVEQMKNRVDCDLWYINNWSLVLDFKILGMTCIELARRRNAY